MNDGIDMGGGCHFLGERNEGGKARQTANQTNGPVALPQKSAHVATRLEDDSCDYVGQRGQRATCAAALLSRVLLLPSIRVCPHGIYYG